MKVTPTEDLGIQLEEVFSGLTLKTAAGETMSICMRDSGFEFNYQGKWYFAKEGQVGSYSTVKNNNWTEEEVKHLMMYVEASDHETAEERYMYVHHMMYNEGNHPNFPIRTLAAVTAKIRQVSSERRKK